MAMDACQGCGKMVDTTAKACPYCGRENPTPQAAGEAGCIALVSLIVAIIIAVCWWL